MEELFLFLLGCAATLAVLAAPFVLAITWRRARRHERELDELRREVRALKVSMAASAAAAARSAHAPAVAVAPASPVAPATSAPSAPSATLATSATPATPVVPPARAAGATPPPAPPAPPNFPFAPSAPSAPPTPRAAPAASGPVDRGWDVDAEEARAPRPKAAPLAVDWERWIGVRGAAVVGGVFLALAAIFFFKHAFTQGWISPEARVLAGIAGGIAAIAVAARLRSRGYAFATSALEGAGLVALYASTWAADERYQLISMAASFPAMAAITALACALALRHGSLFTALLALAGGFATPLLLADGPARTLPLFGYVLLLDAGLLVVARRRGWPSLALLALVATLAFEALSAFGAGESPALALPIAALFALVFAASGARARSKGARWLATQALAVLVPFALGLRYASEARFGPHVWPTAAFLALLVVAAAVVARAQGAPWLAAAAALAAAGVVGAWARGLPPGAQGTELALVAVGLALVSHVLAEWERTRARGDAWARAAAAGAAAWALLVVLAAGSRRLTGFPELALAQGALAALLLRHAGMLRLAPLAWWAGGALGLALGLAHGGYTADLALVEASLPDPRVFWCVPVALAAVLLALGRSGGALARGAPAAAGTLLASCAAVAAFVADEPGYGAYEHTWLVPSAAAPFGVLLLLVAARLSSGGWAVGCALVTAGLGFFGGFSLALRPGIELVFALLAGPALVQALAPAFARELGPRRAAWPALAGLTLALLVLVDEAWSDAFEGRFDGAASALAGVPAALAAFALARRGAPRAAIGWMAAAAALAFSVAAADPLDRSEGAITFALFAAALAEIARRFGLRGAALGAAGSALVATVALAGAALDPWTYERSERLLANWIDYAHLVPAAALSLALARLPRLDGRVHARLRPVVGGCVLGIVFAWLNLVIENAFARTPRLALGDATGHARDLATSLGWGAYAIALLVLGTARRVSALRWTSLAVFVLSIGKVFLHDLGHLDGLYRVASLAGLALSLIAVSLFYQRFVFRRVGASA